MAETPGDDRTLYDARTAEGEIEAHHVDVRQAEDAFNELSKTLSRRKHDSTSSDDTDPEKGEEPFDLRDYLQSSNDARQSAGIKHKHVGVTWEDLQVQGAGGIGSKVRQCFLRDVNENLADPVISWCRSMLRRSVVCPLSSSYYSNNT